MPPKTLSPPQQRRLLRAEEEKRKTLEQVRVVARQNKLDESLKRWCNVVDKEAPSQ